MRNIKYMYIGNNYNICEDFAIVFISKSFEKVIMFLIESQRHFKNGNENILYCACLVFGLLNLRLLVWLYVSFSIYEIKIEMKENKAFSFQNYLNIIIRQSIVGAKLRKETF